MYDPVNNPAHRTPVPKKKFTWGRKKTKPLSTRLRNNVTKKAGKISTGTSSGISRKHTTGASSGIRRRLRSAGGTPEKAIYISDSENVNTPAVTDSHPRRPKMVEPRRSLRVTVQGDLASAMSKAQKRKNDASSSSIGMSLINRFPYSRLTLAQIIDLFIVYQINLGYSEEDRPLIIACIKQMDR